MLGNNVLVVGSGMVGLETAEHLSSQNRRATIVEMLDDVGNDISFVTKYFLLQNLKEGGVEIHTKTKVEKLPMTGPFAQVQPAHLNLPALTWSSWL